MALYCSASHIQSEFKSIVFDTTTSITLVEVERFIEEESAYIDARIGAKYLLPISSAPISLILLRKLCIDLVASRVKSKLSVKTGDDKTSQGSDSNPREAAEKNLDKIVKGTILLSDATIYVSHDGVQSYTYNNEITSEIDVTQTQW